MSNYMDINRAIELLQTAKKIEKDSTLFGLQFYLIHTPDSNNYNWTVHATHYYLSFLPHLKSDIKFKSSLNFWNRNIYYIRLNKNRKHFGQFIALSRVLIPTVVKHWLDSLRQMKHQQRIKYKDYIL